MFFFPKTLSSRSKTEKFSVRIELNENVLQNYTAVFLCEQKFRSRKKKMFWTFRKEKQNNLNRC